MVKAVRIDSSFFSARLVPRDVTKAKALDRRGDRVLLRLFVCVSVFLVGSRCYMSVVLASEGGGSGTFPAGVLLLRLWLKTRRGEWPHALR